MKSGALKKSRGRLESCEIKRKRNGARGMNDSTLSYSQVYSSNEKKSFEIY